MYSCRQTGRPHPGRGGPWHGYCHVGRRARHVTRPAAHGPPPRPAMRTGHVAACSDRAGHITPLPNAVNSANETRTDRHVVRVAAPRGRRPRVRIARKQIALHLSSSKETVVDAAARVTSKGQVTVPKAVREALGIRDGDELIFRVEGNRAVLARTAEFLTLAGSIRVPAAKRNVAWDEVIRRTRSARAAARR